MTGYVAVEGNPFYSPSGEDVTYASENLWRITLTTIGVLSKGRIASNLASSFGTALWLKLTRGSTITLNKVWQGLYNRYTAKTFFATKYQKSLGTKRYIKISPYLPDDTLLTKISNNWSVKIIKGTMVLFLLGAALYIASLFVVDETAATVLSFVGQALILVTSTILVLLEIIQIMAKLQDVKNVPKGIATMINWAKSTGTKQLSVSYVKANVIGFIIDLIVIWGTFVYQLSEIGWDTSGIAFDLLLAYAIVSTIIATILFIISLLFPVGTIIILIYGIIEAILAFISLFVDEVSTIQEALVEAIVDAIYNINYMIANFTEAERLAFEVDYGLLDTSLGYASANSLIYTMTVTNTIVATDTFENQSRNTFNYYLQYQTLDQHPSLTLDQMKDEWVQVNDIFTIVFEDGSTAVFDGARMTQTVVITLPFVSAGTGVNERIPTFYLTEAYALGIEGCWQIIWEFDCVWETATGSNHMDIDYLVFDIFPNTLKDFVSLDWSGPVGDNNLANLRVAAATITTTAEIPFPDQFDQDGDGLLNPIFGGVDPDDTLVDTDGDGLSDPLELSYGLDPKDPDMDDDGLTDAEELFVYYTDPTLADTDGDTLSDYFELIQGWLVNYTDATGATQVTRVWSDPFYADADGDNLTDLQEFTFGFHPEIKTDPSRIATIVEFSDIGVAETAAPVLLLRMEEDSHEAGFADISGAMNNASCDSLADSCPVAGGDGVYGNGLAFDGVDDTLVISNTEMISLSNGSFTVAAWAKRESSGGHDYIVWQGTNVQHQGLHFGFRSNDRFTCAFWANDLTAPDTYTDSDWHHWACTYDAETGQRLIYRDGVSVDNDTATANYQGNGPLYVASRLGAGHFDGSLDEVLVYDHALTGEEVMDVMNGRYNPDDGFLRAGDPLTYQATVTNTSATQGVDGLLVGTSTTVDPAVGNPEAYLSFDDDENRIRFETEIGSDSLTCLDNGTCPTIGVTGIRDQAVHFDGIDDFISLPAINRPDTDEQVFSFWLDVDTLPTGNDRAYLLDTDSEEAGALDLYLNANGKLVVDILGTGAYSSSFTLTDNSGWQNVFFWVRARPFSTQLYDRFNYGGENGHTLIGEDTFTVLIGPGTLGNNVAGDSGFVGAIDDLVFYPESFGNDNATVSYFYHEAVYDGDFYLGRDTPNISDHIPSLLVRFNETSTDYDREMINHVSDGGLMTCDSVATCPTIDSNGIYSEGVQFDGNDFLKAVTAQTFAVDNYTVGLWFKTTDTSQQVLLLGLDASDDGDVILLELSATGIVRYLHRYPGGASGGTNLYSPTSYNDGAWHYLTAVKESNNMTLYIDGNLVAQTDAAASQGPAAMDIILGKLSSGSRYLTGSMDELIWLPTAVYSDGVNYLMNSIYPAIEILDDFVTYNAGAEEAVTVAGTASVDDTALTSVHLFETEVEAALQLQAGFTYPVIDDNAASLDYFFPFEDVPGTTTFDNVMSGEEGLCPSGDCPVGGVRGVVQRSVYFDGVDDYLEVDTGNTSDSPAETIAVWVKAERGTIVDATKRNGGSDRGIELDVGNLLVVTDNGTLHARHNLPFDIPQNEWTHLVAVTDLDNEVASVYINGTFAASMTLSIYHNDSQSGGPPAIGANGEGNDFLKGYLDDLRIYKTPLSAAEVQALYEESVPLFRFEFDEESDALLFVDALQGYVGTPTHKQCNYLTLNSFKLNALSGAAANVYIAVDDQWLYYDATANHPLGETTQLGIQTGICDNTAVSVGMVDNGGTVAQVGLLNTNATVTGTVTQTFSAGLENVTLSFTIEDDLYTQPNPIPGTDGQIGNTALFNGEAAIEIADDIPLNLAIADFTLMGWVKTDLAGSGILNKSDGDIFIENGEKSFYIDFNGQPAFAGQGNGLITGTTIITDDLWHHIAVAWDYDGSGIEGTGSIFVDGVDVTGVDTYSAIFDDNGSDRFNIGYLNAGVGIDNFYIFDGQLDELTAYQRALSEAEILSIYLMELRWYRDQVEETLIVDEDFPAVDMLSTYEYRADGYVQLVANITDASSPIALVQFGLKRPGEVDFSWSTPSACTDSPVAYCPTFISSGEGIYEVQFRVVDAVGNETMSDVYSYVVDHTPPQAGGGSLQSRRGSMTAIPFTITENSSRHWTLTFSGLLTDPNVDSRAGSGVDADTIRITLYDGIQNVLGAPSQAVTTFDNGTWTVNYQVKDAPPVGVYTVTVSVEDEVGNATSYVAGTIELDERETDTLVAGAFLPQYVVSDTLMVRGVVYDYPVRFGKILDLHFEEAPLSTSFYDYSDNRHLVTCTNCPTTNVETPFGRALAFDGVNDSLVISDSIFLDELLDDGFTMALWVKADSDQVLTSSVDNSILEKWSGSGGYPYVIRYHNQSSSHHGHVVVNRYDGTSSGIMSTHPINDGAFHHLAFVKDGDQLYLYIDGKLDGQTADTTVPANTSNNSPLYIGQRGGSADHYFGGVLDEITILDQALTAKQIYALAQSKVNGVGQVEWALEEISDLTLLPEPLDESAQTWQTAVLDQINTAATEWSFTIPNSGLESYYQVHLRSADAGGNPEVAGTVWHGLIDQVAPVVTATGQWINGYPFAQTEYTFTFSDFILHEATSLQPCAVGELVYLTYDDATLPQDGLPYQIGATCRVDGHEPSRTFIACDGAGNCTNETVTPDPNPEVAQLIEIDNPTSEMMAAGGAVPIDGRAFATGGIEMIAVQVNGATVDTLTYGGSISGTLWSTNNWVPTVAGMYTITAVLTDTFNNSTSDTITTTIAACAVEYTGDDVTDFVSLDASALQNAVDAADAEDVIKIAGTCAGVQTVGGDDQTVYITKSLTLQGGYNPDAWLATPSSALTTTLDAQGQGRVIEVASNMAITLDHLKITGGNDSIGGGILVNPNVVLTLTNSLVTSNTSGGAGAGIRDMSNATVTISNTTFSYNQTGGSGGTIYMSGGTLTLNNSTLYQNTASDYGGGIVAVATDITMTNSTVSHHLAGAGSVIYFVLPFGSITLINNTIVSNTATMAGESTVYAENSVVMHNNLFAYNTFSNCDIQGTVITATYNLDSDGSCGLIGSGNISGTNPALGPLANNGGDTWTYLPTDTSVGVDAIPAANCLTSGDQRGVSRPQGGGCDMGAVEVEASAPPVSPILTIAVVGNGVQLDWSDEAANCSYTVYRSSSPYSGFTAWQNNLNVLTISDFDGLSNNTFYYVEATACSGGETAVSNTVGAFTFALEA